jgi:ABC-type oligopeptide transport system substrate-binding subunit
MRVLGSLALLVAGLALGTAAWAKPQQGHARLWVRPQPAIFALEFAPGSPLFENNPDLRRAVNYALDRPKLVSLWGPYHGRPTARLIPPATPGWSTRQPYPLDAPNLTLARRLAEGNLRGGRALLPYYWSGLRPLVDEITRELAQIGIEVVPSLERGICQGCRPTQPDMWLGGMGADYPSPASVLRYWAPRAEVELASRERRLPQLDWDLMTLNPPAAPYMALNARGYMSERTHCLHWNVYYGWDVGRLCVR